MNRTKHEFGLQRARYSGRGLNQLSVEFTVRSAFLPKFILNFFPFGFFLSFTFTFIQSKFYISLKIYVDVGYKNCDISLQVFSKAPVQNETSCCEKHLDLRSSACRSTCMSAEERLIQMKWTMLVHPVAPSGRFLEAHQTYSSSRLSCNCIRSVLFSALFVVSW